MSLKITTLDFTTLLTENTALTLFDQLSILMIEKNSGLSQTLLTDMATTASLSKPDSVSSSTSSSNRSVDVDSDNSERIATDWLIQVFNTLFAQQNVKLVRGNSEPEYFAATATHPARIEFAHGFFASALHEISHWCVAGQKRRRLNDFGYWYAPDGRSQEQQQAFERVEIKPQALECLFTLACQRPFQVSQDNILASFDTGDSTFAQDVYKQAQHYITYPHTLPTDAQTLLWTLLCID